MNYTASEFSNLLTQTGLIPDEAKRRAPLLVEALDWLQPEIFEIKVEPAWLPSGQAVPVVEYTLGPNSFDFNNATSPDDNRHTSVGGSGLNRFPLRLLAKAATIAKARLSHLWLRDEGMKTYLRSPHWHMGRLNEILWLDRFAVTELVSDGVRLRPDTDVDWRFRVPVIGGSDVWINLEVKHRDSDVVRGLGRTDGPSAALVKNLTRKFPVIAPDEINVVAITVFGQIDRQLQSFVRNWLTTNQSAKRVLDAVVLWPYEARSSPDFHLEVLDPLKGALLRAMLRETDEDERSIIHKYCHAMSRNMMPAELRDALPRFEP